MPLKPRLDKIEFILLFLAVLLFFVIPAPLQLPTFTQEAYPNLPSWILISEGLGLAIFIVFIVYRVHRIDNSKKPLVFS